MPKVQNPKLEHYGCVMLNVDFDLAFFQDLIDKEDIYNPDGEHGLEDNPHITLLYGLTENTPPEVITNITNQYTFSSIGLPRISIFECDDYDVLKFEAESPILDAINKQLIEEAPYYNSHDEYSPHLTIAYLNKGAGEDYVEIFKGMSAEAQPTDIWYSTIDGKDIYLPIEIATEEITEEIIYSMVPGLTVAPSSSTWINAQNDSAIEGKADYYGNGAAGGPDGMGSSNDELTQFQAGLFRNRDTRLVYDGTINTQRSNPLYSTDTMGESEEVLPESVVTTSSNIANPAPAVLSADRHNAEQRARIGSVLQNFDVKGDSKKILHEDASNYSVEVKPIEGDCVIKVTYLTKSHEFKYSELVPLKDELLDAINDGLFNAFAQVADEEDVKILPEIATYIEDKIHDISQNALVKESLMETTLIEKLNLSKFMQYGLLDMVAFAEYLEEYKEAPEYLPPTDDIFLDDAYVSMSPEELLDVEDSIALALNEMTRDKRFSHLLMGTPTGVVNALTQYFAQNEAHIPYENTRAVPKLSAPLWEDNASLERDISNIGKQYDIIATHFEDGTHKITFTADSTKEDGNITPREFMNFERDLSQLAGVKDVRIDTYDYKITVYLGESQKGINMNKTKLVAAKLAEAEEVQTKENNMLSNPQVAQVVRVIYEQRSQFGEDYEFLSPNEVARMAQEQGFELSYNEIASIAYEIKDLVEALELDTLGAVDFDMQAALAGTPEVVAVDNTAAPAEELPEELESATVLKGKGVEVKEALVIEASAVQNNATEFLSSNGAILSGFRGKRKYKDKEVYDFNGSYQVILTSSNLELFESGKLIYQTSNKEVIKAFREIMLKLNKVNNKQDIDANKAVIMELLLDMQYSGSTLDANHSMSEADNKNKTVEGWAKELGKPYSEIHKYWLKAEKEADKKLPKKDYWKEVNYIAQRMIGAKYGEFKPTKESLGEAVKLKESVAPEYANEDGFARFNLELDYIVEVNQEIVDSGDYSIRFDVYAKTKEELGAEVYEFVRKELGECATFNSVSKEEWIRLFLDPHNSGFIEVLPEDYELLGFTKVSSKETISFVGAMEVVDEETQDLVGVDGSFDLDNHIFTEELTPTALQGQPATMGEAGDSNLDSFNDESELHNIISNFIKQDNEEMIRMGYDKNDSALIKSPKDMDSLCWGEIYNEWLRNNHMPNVTNPDDVTQAINKSLWVLKNELIAAYIHSEGKDEFDIDLRKAKEKIKNAMVNRPPNKSMLGAGIDCALDLVNDILYSYTESIGEADIALDEDGLVEVGTYYLPTWAIAPLMNGDISELTNEEDSALASFETKFSTPVYDFHEDTREFCKTNDVDGSEGECIKCTVYENSMEEAYDDLPKNKHMGMGLETDDHFYEGGKRTTVKCTFDDGDSLVTSINTDLEGAKKYYLGKRFNMWVGGDEGERSHTCVKVEEVGGGLDEASEHEGFAKTASHIAHKEHIPEKNAAAILANAGRKASAKAHRENPRLNKIKGEAMESKQKGGDMNKIQEGGGAGYEITFKGLLSYDIESNRGWKGISDIIEVPYQDEVSIEGYDWSTTWAGKCGVLRLMKKSLIFSIIQLDDKLKEAIDIYLTDFNIEPFIYGAGSSFSLIQPNEPIDVMVQIYANIDGSIVYPYVSAKFYPSEELSYAVEDAYNHEEDEYYDDEEEPYDESLNKKSNKSIVKESIMNNKQFKQLKESLISNNRKPVSKLSVSLFKEELKESQKPEPLKESLIMPISGFEYSVFKKGNLGEGSGKMITQGIAMVEGQNVKVNGKSFSIKSHDFVGTKGY